MEIIAKFTPGVFKIPFTDELHTRLYGSVITRCLGYGVPSTLLFPMGDNFNHNDSLGIGYEVVSTKMHISPTVYSSSEDLTPKHPYFSKQKYMNDYSTIFTKDQIECYPNLIQGRINRDNFAKNQE